MNVALIVHDLLDGIGHGHYTRVLADWLAARGDRVAVYANRCQSPGEAGWSWRPVRAWRARALSAVFTFPLGLGLHRRELATWSIRHAQGYCGGSPNVVTAHICTQAYRDSLVGATRQTRLSLGLMARAERAFYRRFRGRVIAISEKIADELRDLYGVRQPIDVIPHGVDLERFSTVSREDVRAAERRRLGIGDGRTVALYVGDLAKTHAGLRELAARAPGIQLLVASRSPGYRWEAENVSFLGSVDAVERLYAAADAFVFPTTYDAFGLVAVEAMACGLPVFCSDQAGAAERIESGRHGLVSPLPSWAEATAAALGNAEALRVQGEAAALTAQDFRWDHVAARVAEVYATVATTDPRDSKEAG